MQRRLKLTLSLAALVSLAFVGVAHAAGLPVGPVAVAHVMQHADVLGSFGDMSALLGMGAAGAFGAIGNTSTENHAQKSKWFRIALEGATTDGRNIERVWLEQMARNYNRQTYGARINLEHIRGYSPNSDFKAYGDVIALETREEEGGKLGLYAQIEPTPELVAMTKAKQKIYTSCEIHPSFADTKEAYLVGLAVTDSPASLGTEILSFAAKNPNHSPFKDKKQDEGNLFTATADPVAIEFEAAPIQITAMFKRVGELLGIVKEKGAADDARFNDAAKAIELLATHGREQSETVGKQATQIEQLTKQLGEANTTIEKLTKDFGDLQAKLSNTPGSQPARPAATGGNGAVVTDC